MNRFLNATAPIVLILFFLTVLVMSIWWQVLFSSMSKKQSEAELSKVENHLLKLKLEKKAEPYTEAVIVSRCTLKPCIKLNNDNYLQIKQAAFDKIKAGSLRRSRIIYYEGFFLSLNLFAGMVYFFISILRERKRNKDRWEVLSLATHELKRPVSALRLTIESLQRGTIPKEKTEHFLKEGIRYLDTIQAEADKMLQVQELQFQRPTAAAPYKLVDFIKGLCEKSALLHEREIHFEEPPTALETTLNQDALKIIFDNIIENSCKYSTETINVSIYSGDAKSLLQISDTGIGLTAEDIKNSFMLFYRSKRHKVQNTKGSGIGLYLVKILCDEMKIKVKLSSPGENQGSTFELEIK